MTKIIEIPTKFWLTDFFTIEEKHKYINYLCDAQDNPNAYLDDILRAKMENNGFSYFTNKTEQVKEILTYFNQIKGLSDAQGYKPTGSRKKIILARVKEFDVETCKNVVTYMGKKWLVDDNMKHNFTPDTIFRPSNFDKYRVEMETSKKTSTNGSVGIKKIEVKKYNE